MKSKHLLIAGVALAGTIAFAAATRAATVNSGDLIRSSDPAAAGAVYYYGANGKRYVFPNEKTYKTWYADFSAVKTVTLAELQALPLGGNVTYRPGVKLVKITTDPKVYAVAANGTLRWLQTEAVAAALYGADWNTKVDDIPDPFFINYKVGSPIGSSADFSPATASAAATDINSDLKLTATPCPSCQTPTPTSTPSTPTTPTSTPATDELTFTLSRTQAMAGDIVGLNASAQTKDGVSKIELFFDGALVTTCASTYCSGEVPVPLAGTKTAYACEARLTKLTQQVVSESLTLPIQNNGSDKVTVKVGQAQIMPNQLASASAEVSSSVDIERIDVYVDNTVVRSCVSGTQLCSWADYLTNQAIGSVHPVKAIVTDKLGRPYTSQTLTITVSENDAPAVTIAPAKTAIYAGETLDVTVNATDSSGISGMDILRNGTLLKHCDGAAACTAATGPWNTAGEQLVFEGRATDTKGAVSSSTSATATVLPKP